jgi:glycosyltransferase involved in cell wall biosynthesis
VESVVDGKTGVLFHEASEKSAIEAIRQFMRLPEKQTRQMAKERAALFSRARFEAGIRKGVDV